MRSGKLNLFSTLSKSTPAPTDCNEQTKYRYQIGFFHKVPHFVALFFGLSFQFADSGYGRPTSSLKKSLYKT
jgi:hypothetical protein